MRPGSTGGWVMRRWVRGGLSEQRSDSSAEGAVQTWGRGESKAEGRASAKALRQDVQGPAEEASTGVVGEKVSSRGSCRQQGLSCYPMRGGVRGRSGAEVWHGLNYRPDAGLGKD